MKLYHKKTPMQITCSYLWMVSGAFLAALSIRVFLYPNELIDGGVIGISMILGRLLGGQYLSIFIVLLNLPFLYLAYKHIRRSFVIQMSIAILIFSGFLAILEFVPPFEGDPLEIIVFGGAVLGAGIGLIIRHGGCTDGSEILGIIANKKFGFTVGQVVLFFNFFVFGAYGLIFLDWHIALRSMMTYIVAFKMIDIVIVGLEELKSVMIISSKADELKKAIISELGLGLTVLNAEGGWSGEQSKVLMVIIERLDLADLKELIFKNDKEAFFSIQNLYEVMYGLDHSADKQKKRARISK